MNVPRFLKSRRNRIIICFATILLLAGLSVYFAVIEKDLSISYLNYLFNPTVSGWMLIIIPLSAFVIVFPLILGILGNDISATLDEGGESNDKSNQIPLRTEVKTYRPQSETNQLDEDELENQKFYPNKFVPDLKFFEGRQKLLGDIERTLSKEHRASIHDISGLGKTFTTYKFADLHKDEYEKIFFVLASKDEMLGSLAAIAILLDPSLQDESDQTILANSFKDWLATNENWLVIYDNVDKPLELKPFVPVSSKGDCLFTSNYSSVSNLGTVVNIEKLSAKESRKLLFGRSQNIPHKIPKFDDKKEEKAFNNIVTEIDGHPLALNTTGAFISQNLYKFQAFANKLKKTPDILLKHEDGYDNYQHKSVLKAFSIAIDDISKKKPKDKFVNSNILARQILNIVSFIAPEEIPEILLKNAFEMLLESKTFLQRVLSILSNTDVTKEEKEDLWQEIRLKLLAYDLLKYDKSLTMLNTHRLVQNVIDTKLPEKEQNKLLLITINAIDELFPDYAHETKADCELYAPHAIALIEKIEKTMPQSEKIADIYEKIGTHLRENIKYEESIGYFEKAIVNFEKSFGKESEDVPRVLNAMAIAYKAQGKNEKAIKFFKQAIDIDKNTLDGEHSDYAASSNNLAIVYMEQGKHDEAIKLYKEVIEIDKKSIGEEHRDYATGLNNLALVYALQEKYDKAIKLYNEAIVISKKTIGEEHPDYANGLGNLAMVYKAQGKYEKAIKLCQEAIDIDKKTIGEEHPDYALDLNNLAMVFEAQGNYEDALPLYQEALRILVEFLGEDHPTTQSLKENLKGFWEDLERKEEKEKKGKGDDE